MGYDVHITRASHWTESESHPISLKEWDDYIQCDSEMRRDDQATAKVDGDLLTYENEGLAVWCGYSKSTCDGNLAWFDFRNGMIVVKNPDQEMIGKMKTIAAKLNARVFGDEGEEY